MSQPSLSRPRGRQALLWAMRVVAAAALFAGPIDAVSPARAARASEAAPVLQAPMRFTRVTSGDPACRPDCPEWISAEGKIVTGTADALGRVIAALGDRRLPIFIDSAGGSVPDAMAMGRLIRAKRLAVVVAHTLIAPCPASARDCGEAQGSAESWGAYCASACTLVLAGGIERYVSPLSLVGVHQLTQLFSKSEIKRSYAVRYLELAGLKLELSRTLVGERRSTSTTKRTADKGVDDRVALYLAEMGVRDPVMGLMLTTPASDVRWLTADELRTSRMATIWVDDPSPIVADAGASGLRGEPIDPQSGAASLFAARAAAPLARPIEGRPAEIEASFTYRRGGGTVLAALLARDSTLGTPVDLRGSGILMTLYPEGAEFRAEKTVAGDPMRVAVPLRSFCKLKSRGSAVVGFIEPIGAAGGEIEDAAHPREPAAAIDPLAAEGAKTLFDEACPQNAVAAEATSPTIPPPRRGRRGGAAGPPRLARIAATRRDASPGR